MSRPTMVVNGYSSGWLGKGFPWVYPKEVVRGGGRPGEELELQDGRGMVLGRGLADQGFLAARVYRHDGGPLDEAWLHGTLDRAAELRGWLIDEGTTAFRLVNAENDGLPGLRVDRWGAWFTIVLDSEGVLPLVEGVGRWLTGRHAPEGVVLCYRPDHRDARSVPEAQVWSGAAPEGPVEVRERGIRYGVWPAEGPDVGLYADMREVRAWLEPRWAGTRVLNLFAFTAAFSVSAVVHGASEAVSVDLSGPYLERARHNFVLNGLDPEQHRFETEDVFKALDRFRRKGERFDRVVIDPPSFSRGKATFSAKKDWPRLVSAAARVLTPDGWLVVASNQGEMSPRAFDGAVADGLRKAGRVGQVLATMGQGPDFPASTVFPEGRYLKVRVVRVG